MALGAGGGEAPKSGQGLSRRRKDGKAEADPRSAKHGVTAGLVSPACTLPASGGLAPHHLDGEMVGLALSVVPAAAPAPNPRL